MTADRLLTIVEIAEWLQRPVATLRRWRMHPEHAGPTPFPPAIKVGAAVRYRESDIDAWLDAVKESPTWVAPQPLRASRRRVS